MKLIFPLKSLVLCLIILFICFQGFATSINTIKENHFNQKIAYFFADTSNMFYYSFKHQKTIKFQELLNDSDISYIQTCVGRELILTAPNYGETAKYSWEGPNGFTSQLAELKIDEVQLKHDGIYRVNVLKDDLTVLGKIKLIVKPMPEAVVKKVIFMEDQAIKLQAADTMLEAKFEWRGMDMKIISKSKDLWISPKKKGTYNYFLTVSKEGCEVSKNIEIVVGTETSNPTYNSIVDVLRHSND